MTNDKSNTAKAQALTERSKSELTAGWSIGELGTRFQGISKIIVAAFAFWCASANVVFADCVDLVDPLINSDHSRIFQTKTASRPFGLVQMAPDTIVGDGGLWGGYSFGTANVKGFGHVRDWRIAGMLVMPTQGGVSPSGPDSWNSDFSHETEVAQAGYHKLILDRYGITAEITSTMRVGMHRWTFSKGGHADIMFDMMTYLNEAGPEDCEIRKVSDTEMEGWVQMASDGGARKYKIFFVAQFDKPMMELRAWKTNKELGAVSQVSGFPVVGFPRFNISAKDVLQMKLALSYCNVDQARTNMNAELNHWDFDQVRSDSRTEWNDLLKRIEVTGGSEDQQKNFYTDLWHVLLGRSTISDANGKYPDRTGGSLIIRDLPRKNIASMADVSASSAQGNDYSAEKVSDGVIGKRVGEWRSQGESKPWIQLTWPTPQTLNRVDLFDRADVSANVNSGRLMFSDSTSIVVTDIPADGQGKVVTFDDKTVHWVRFEVTESVGADPGLSEIKARDANSDPEFKMYNSDSFWWSQWNLNLLWGMVYPDVLKEWVQSSLQVYEDDPNRRLPWGMVAGGHSWIMSGSQRIPLIARAIQMDMKGIDLIKAYQSIVKTQHVGNDLDTGNIQWGEAYERLGYVPIESVSFAASQTLEHAYCDWVVAQAAAKMGDTRNHDYFLKRSGNWKNIWNPETGFLMPRHADGSWKDPFDPFEGGYQGYIEGNAWHYLWFSVHDVMGLSNLMGGAEIYSGTLDRILRKEERKNYLNLNGYVDFGNQPAVQIAHLFNYVGKPWLSQYWVRQVNAKAYGDIRYAKGLGVGDEDQGMMGGVSALMSMGLFSIRGCTARDPIYEITSPVFDTVTIHLDPDYYTGETFVVDAKNNSDENLYIQSAKLDGKPLTNCWFYHRDFADGGTLELVLGPEPNKQWGSAESGRPPSESKPNPVKPHPMSLREQLASLKDNLAFTATVTTSSDFDGNHSGENATDQSPGEWASSGETTPWIQLDWNSSRSVNEIRVKDRINLSDHASEGILTFSDGSRFPVSDIPNDGTVRKIRFPVKDVTWVRFQVTEGMGNNNGLQEIEVYAPTTPGEQ